jgi:hypothetical protein
MLVKFLSVAEVLPQLGTVDTVQVSGVLEHYFDATTTYIQR